MELWDAYDAEFNKIENMGQDIHITDLITQLNIQFADELEYLEFYGINDYSADSAQIIETWSVEDINALGYNKYIPEFIKITTSVHMTEIRIHLFIYFNL